jgi:PAS domain S-box-containing protein
MTDEAKTMETLAGLRAALEADPLFRQMFVTNTAIKLLIDPADGTIVDANPAACRFYGYPPEILCSMRVSDINPLPPGEIRAEMARALSEDRLHFRFPHRIASGEIRDVEVYSGPFEFQGHKLLHSIIHDVTESNRHARELERSNEELQRFAYVASHDLQEPLRSVVTFLSLLERRHGHDLPPDAKEYIGYAVTGAKRMQALIRDLLEFSRVQTAGQKPMPVDANAVLDLALIGLKARLEETEATLDRGPLPWVLADHGQLLRLFQNLIGNALKYRDPDRRPEIRVTASRDGNLWSFAVADNGIGIDKPFHDRIFGIFQRLHAQTEYEGTGIGLAICRRIVERHGGAIWVESEPGQGATFRFTLKAAQAPEEQGPATSSGS